jgi:predicted GIY-YIG superfamily endonuclease
LPAALVFGQSFSSREEVLVLERQIKGLSRQEQETVMRGDWTEFV